MSTTTDTNSGRPGARGTRLFNTAIGRCGVAWIGDAVSAVQIPESSDDVTLGRLTAKGNAPATSSRPPASIVSAIEAMSALLEGEVVDLNFIDIELGSPPAFEAAVWEITRTIPVGSSLTYGQVAKQMGQPGAARSVGRALGANPCPIVVPCHRVLGADGSMVGFSASGGIETKRRMLLIERCPAVPPSLFD